LVTQFEHTQEGTVKMAGPMARFGGTPADPPLASPALGEHAAEILSGLGFSQQDIKAWKEAGVVG
jgi:crotonobetainyl-CoA:carnitine CoA-transferase CaiB-like acyl-CoA transferase